MGGGRIFVRALKLGGWGDVRGCRGGWVTHGAGRRKSFSDHGQCRGGFVRSFTRLLMSPRRRRGAKGVDPALIGA